MRFCQQTYSLESCSSWVLELSTAFVSITSTQLLGLCPAAAVASHCALGPGRPASAPTSLVRKGVGQLSRVLTQCWMGAWCTRAVFRVQAEGVWENSPPPCFRVWKLFLEGGLGPGSFPKQPVQNKLPVATLAINGSPSD